MDNFDDVTPLPIETELEDELCRIMYTDEYRETLGLARALLQAGEYSERALKLTAKVISLAPAFYTIWNYRYDIVMHLATQRGEVAEAIDRELDWVDEVTLNNPKNYQIWSYKQALLQKHPFPSFRRELPILQMMIEDDTKNYHVWSFRKWCVLFFQDFSHELSYSDLLIKRDIYNNSAWTHRMFVFKHSEPDSTQIKLEIDYVKDKIELVPQNVSVWSYLRGLYENFWDSKYDESIIKFAASFTSNVQDFDHKDSSLPEIESSHALEFLANIYAYQENKKQNAIRAYLALSSKYDPIRKVYWQRQISLIK